jgi:hypothetical protein
MKFLGNYFMRLRLQELGEYLKEINYKKWGVDCGVGGWGVVYLTQTIISP